MDKAVKREIFLMIVPFIGLWFIIDRILPKIGTKVEWWDISPAKLIIIPALFFYQLGLLVVFKWCVCPAILK